MTQKRKPTYEQALGMQKGLATAHRNRRRQALAEPTLSPEQNAEWERKKKEALARYRAKKAAHDAR